MTNATSQALQQSALQLTESDRFELAMDLLDSLPRVDELLSVGDEDLLQELSDRGTDEKDAMTWEQLQGELFK